MSKAFENLTQTIWVNIEVYQNRITKHLFKSVFYIISEDQGTK